MPFSRELFLLSLMCMSISFGHSTHRSNIASSNTDESNPLFDMASVLIHEALSQRNDKSSDGNSGSEDNFRNLADVASLIGTFMQSTSGSNGNNEGVNRAMQIISGIGSILSNSGASNRGYNGGFDPSLIKNIIDVFSSNSLSDETSPDTAHRNKRSNYDNNPGIGLESILKIASAFMNTNSNSNTDTIDQSHQKKRSASPNISVQNESQYNGLAELLPMIAQTISSFAGPEGQRTQEKHKNHAWVLPPFLEHLHVLWDHFSNSDLADALYERSGINAIFKGFKGRNGKLDYDKLFESLNNQSFRRRWIKAATLYFADWANYLADPEVYLKSFQTVQFIFNGFLKSQGYPKNTFFDPNHPTETISNLLDHTAKQHLKMKFDSRGYVKPAVGYAKELLKLGQARWQKFNATELSDKLTDTLNLEVIEPILKVHRAYRFILKSPKCDRYVLCELNSYETSSSEKFKGLISGFSPKIIKIGSMAAAIFISTETGTPFWTLLSVINSPHTCDSKYPVDCTGFHEGEAKVTTEYIHNEL